MKLHIRKQYYKNIRRGEEPCKYTAVQPKGKGTDVHAVIKLDPILKKSYLKPVKDAMIRHEMNEIMWWAKGGNAPHQRANRMEPALTRKKLKGVKGFWQYCEKNGL